jgi:uncharacterized protein YnzC (UPF0291/DUF896 family)
MKIVGFAVCLVNDDEDDFKPDKLYPILEPLENDPDEHLRIVDESGEDYLYPETYFQIVNLNQQAQQNLLQYFEAAIH